MPTPEDRLTFEGLRAELDEAIDIQERVVEGLRQELEDASRRLPPGEPALRELSSDYESARERRDLLYGCLAFLNERERRGIPLRHPLLDALAEEILEILD